MANVFVESFKDGDKNAWGLFYFDKDEKIPLKENWKHLAYDSEEDAVSKLKQIELEYVREQAAEPFSLDEAKGFADAHNWKFATTYAKTAPHEYLVKYWLSEEDKVLFERFIQAIRKDSVVGYFYGHKNNYLILDEYYYWYMDCYPDNMSVDLINRTTTDYLEYRDGAYYYKPKESEKESLGGSNREENKA